jgi:hypothetical protein
MRMTLGAIALLSIGCGPKRVTVPDTIGPTVVAPKNLFLRNAFDLDPSVYAGRFVPTDATALDETTAMPLTCSQHLTTTRIQGGGVVYDETFNASAEAALRVGVPAVGELAAGGSRSSVVRVNYELTEKMVVSPKDPAAFETCCKAAPDQCTDRYIGEFIAGKGSVFYAVGSEAEGAGSGKSAQGVTVALDFKNGVAWQRSIEFPNPVFFAFKTTANTWGTDGPQGGCGDWTQAPPRSTQGTYFVGISRPAATEADARAAALLDGREQVVRYVAQAVDTGSIRAVTTSGASDALQTMVEGAVVRETAASGVAEFVKDDAWCVQPEATPGGTLYVAKVLMLLPKAEEEAAAAVLVEAVPAEPGAEPAEGRKPTNPGPSKAGTQGR